jgi:hypothetical protein
LVTNNAQIEVEEGWLVQSGHLISFTTNKWGKTKKVREREVWVEYVMNPNEGKTITKRNEWNMSF